MTARSHTPQAIPLFFSLLPPRLNMRHTGMCAGLRTTKRSFTMDTTKGMDLNFKVLSHHLAFSICTDQLKGGCRMPKCCTSQVYWRRWKGIQGSRNVSWLEKEKSSLHITYMVIQLILAESTFKPHSRGLLDVAKLYIIPHGLELELS